MLHPTSLLLLAVASALPVAELSIPASVVGEFNSIDSAVNALAGQVNGWDTSRTGAVAIISSLLSLDSEVEAYYIAAVNAAGLGSADSQTVVSFMTNTLSSDTNNMVNAFVAREPDFANIGFMPDILHGLQLLQDNINDYDEALINIVSSDQVGYFKGQAINLSEDLQLAINSYST